MERKDRFALYERLYFHELERIEKVSARLGLPFAVLLSAIALLSFMLNSSDLPRAGSLAATFWIFFSLSSAALVVGACFFRKAWFGHTDKFLPTASDIENYYKQLASTYEGYDEAEQLRNRYFEEFLFDYYSRFSSENAINNDTRSFNIYRAIVALMVSVFLAFAAAVPFYIYSNGEANDYDEARTAAATTSAATAQR